MIGSDFKYQFLPIRLRDLESVEGQLLVVSLFEDDRPPRGVAGLLDWRMNGMISRIRYETLYPGRKNPHFDGQSIGPFSAAESEKLMFPLNGRFPFFMALAVGLGPSKRFDSQCYKSVVKTILEAATSLRLTSVTLQLPGWETAGLPARRASDIFLTQWLTLQKGGHPVPDNFCFVEKFEYQAEMDERIVEILGEARARKRTQGP